METEGYGAPARELNRETASRLITRLTELGQLHARVAMTTMDAPMTGSVAAAELSATPEVRRAYDAARQLLTCALDHIATLRLLLVEARTLSNFAPMTILRGALEASLLARWLICCGAEERLGRGFAVNIDNLTEWRKFADCSFGGALPRQRIDELLDKAAALGLVVVKKGTRQLTTSVPNYVDLLGEDAWLYRVLSGYAHAKAWAVFIGLVSPRPPAGSVGVVEPAGEYLAGFLDRVGAIIDETIDALEALWRTGDESIDSPRA